jgi:hypothetical protein
VNRSKTLGALGRFGILQGGKGRTHPGQLPFGSNYSNHRLVKNQAEQGLTQLMRQGRAGGLSIRQIAGEFNQRLVPTKNNSDWQANTVKGILARA